MLNVIYYSPRVGFHTNPLALHSYETLSRVSFDTAHLAKVACILRRSLIIYSFIITLGEDFLIAVYLTLCFICDFLDYT